MIDIDGLEYCQRCSMPLGLIETAFDVGQFKATVVTRALASLANLPAYLAFYSKTNDGQDIESFRVSDITSERRILRPMTPAQFCRLLQELRDRHACPGTLFATASETAPEPRHPWWPLSSGL